MVSELQTRVTRLLQQASAGDKDARGELLEKVYEQLRSIAHQRMAHERGSHTLQATALVHEAYMRLLAVDEVGDAPHQVEWRDRGHVYRFVLYEFDAQHFYTVGAHARDRDRRGRCDHGFGKHCALS